MQKIYSFPLLLLCLFSFGIVEAQTYWGSGSRDLAQNNIGSRAFMISMTCSDCGFNPFPQQGTVYVYAKVGETIHVGSSVQGRTISGGTAEIRLFPPNGRGANPTKYYTTGASTTIGRIQNRAQEIIGPNVPANPNGGGAGGYTPYSQVVQPGEEGIWVINFRTGGTSTTLYHIPVNDDWETLQGTMSTANSAFIAAWDATVVGTDNSIKSGRAFIKLFNGSTNPNSTLAHSGDSNPGDADADGFFGVFYALTKDGFAYKISNNGQNGLSYNTFVNNTGSVKNVTLEAEKTYRSFGYTNSAAGVRDELRVYVWDPRKMDDLEKGYITHKMFYGPPAQDLPVEAPLFYWFPGDNATDLDGLGGSTQNTWLRSVRTQPSLGNVSFIGSEGTPGQAGAKGGYLIFDSNVAGKYKITIPLSAPYTDRILVGETFAGTNRAYWDGLDGNGVRVETGTSLTGVKTQAFGAEIHFPFIDVENNPNGIIIEQLEENFTSYSPARYPVHWNHADFVTRIADHYTSLSKTGFEDEPQTGNSSISSQNTRWGKNHNTANGSNFGDDRLIDVWTFAPGEEYAMEGIKVEVKSYDLEVVNITKTSPAGTLINLGESFTYTSQIRNNGLENAVGDVRATYFFYLPSGTTYGSVTFAPTGGAALVGSPQIISKPGLNVYTVKVDLPNGSGGTFTIPATLNSGTPTSKINAWSAIMRNNDRMDPNASNLDYVNIPNPRDPFEEANGVWKRVEDLGLNAAETTNLGFSLSALTLTDPETSTNNIKLNNVLDSGQEANTTLSISKTGRKATSGGTVMFYITVKNTGSYVATNTIMTDVLGNFNVNTSGSPANINASEYVIPKGTVSYTASPKELKWNIGTLLPGEEVTMMFKTSNGPGTPNGTTWTNIARAVSNEAIQVSASTNIVNNTSNTSNIDASITKTVANHVSDPEKVTFTLVFNKPGTTTNPYTATVVDYLPKGYVLANNGSQGTNVNTNDLNISTASGATSTNTVSYNSATNQIIWNISFTGTNQGSRTLIIHAKLVATESTADFRNLAQITAVSQTDMNLANNIAEATIKSDLRVSKSVNISNPYYGSNVVFTIKAENYNRGVGYFNASGVKVNDLLPSGYSYVSHLAPVGTSYDALTGIWNIGSMGIGTSKDLTITAKVTQGGNLVNLASIAASQPDDVPENNSAMSVVFPKNMMVTNPMIYQKTK